MSDPLRLCALLFAAAFGAFLAFYSIRSLLRRRR